MFAAREGIKVGTLRWWSSRLQRGVTTASAPAPIPIACADHPWGRVGAYIRAGGPALPPWLAEIKPHLHAWRSADRFRKLAQRWRVARFHGDEVGYEALDAWRYRDNHLEPYETGMRRRALLRRREGYRILASNLCQRYRTLVIDDTDLAELKRSPAPESEEVDGIPLVKNNQSLVAGSELRQVLMNAFHGRVEKMSSNDVTRRCYSCGHVDEAWDQSVNTGRERTCPACGLRVDQDANACRNLLLEWANAQETPETARTAKSAIAKPSRSQRLRTARSASTTTRPLET
ncbi:MAG TPA: zinc ribbon domain-containing protein [Kofleriaceae bacterium]|nr:zinc ribbon domain-containing protein [Kofleriaceae bacterium]